MRFEPVVPSPVPGIKIWAAKVGGFSFVITYEPFDYGTDAPQWSGYTATWKNRAADTRPVLPGFAGTQPANRIDGGPWRTFAEAEAACEATLRHLRLRS